MNSSNRFQVLKIFIWYGKMEKSLKESIGFGVKCAIRHFFRPVLYFLSKSFPHNVNDPKCRTPLQYAVANKDSELIIGLSLSHGANIALPDDQACLPLHVASHRGIEKCVSSLLDFGANVNIITIRK